MVNHLRTLLLNLSPSPASSGEEFIESSFQPQILNAIQDSIRQAVFPKAFGRPYSNFIATMLTRLAYNSSFGEKLLSLDPRTLLSDPSAATSGFYGSVGIDMISNASSVTVTGALSPDPINGTFSKSWLVSYGSGTEVLIQDISAALVVTQSLSFINNSSTSFLLYPGSSLKLRLSDVSSVPSGLQALVTATAPMSYDLVALNRRFHSNVIRQVFFLPGVSSDSAQYLSAFDSSSRIDESIAAALTAYASSFEING